MVGKEALLPKGACVFGIHDGAVMSGPFPSVSMFQHI